MARFRVAKAPRKAPAPKAQKPAPAKPRAPAAKKVAKNNANVAKPPKAAKAAARPAPKPAKKPPVAKRPAPRPPAKPPVKKALPPKQKAPAAKKAIEAQRKKAAAAKAAAAKKPAAPKKWPKGTIVSAKPPKAKPAKKPPVKKAPPPKGKKPAAKKAAAVKKKQAKGKVVSAKKPKDIKKAKPKKDAKPKKPKNIKKAKPKKGAKPKKPKNVKKAKPKKIAKPKKPKNLKKAKAPAKKGKKAKKPKNIKKAKPKKNAKPKKPKNIKKAKPKKGKKAAPKKAKKAAGGKKAKAPKGKKPKKAKNVKKAKAPKGKKKAPKKNAAKKAAKKGLKKADPKKAKAKKPKKAPVKKAKAPKGKKPKAKGKAKKAAPKKKNAAKKAPVKKAKAPKGKAPKAKGKAKPTKGPKAKKAPIKKKAPPKGKKPPIKGKQKPVKPKKAPGKKGPASGLKAKPKAPAKGPGGGPAGGGKGGGQTAGKGDTAVNLTTPKYKIKAGKAPKPLPPAVASRMVEIVVDQAVDMADMCKLLIRNDDFSISDSDDFKPGSKIEIELGYEEGGSKLTKCFAGEVCAVQGDFPRRGPMNVRLVAYTQYHRLMRGRWMRSWENKTYADIAKAIAGECGLKAVADATPGQHEYVFQRNQTNHEFLLEIAEKVGFEVFANDGTLFFRKPTADKTKVRTLKKGELLLSFNPRTHVALQPTGVKVLSYDDEKVAMVGFEAKKGDAGPAMQGKQMGVAISEKIQPAVQVVTEQVFRKADGAKALALGMLKEAALNFVRAEATVQGMADLRPGFVVDVQGVGEIFSGPYYITRVVHDFLPTGFSTRLGLRKTSIELAPPGAPPPGGGGLDHGGEINVPVNPFVPQTDGDQKKPILKNLMFDVGDKVPPWFFDETPLDTGPKVEDLKLTYGLVPPDVTVITYLVEPPKPPIKNLKFGYQKKPGGPKKYNFAGPAEQGPVEETVEAPELMRVKLGYQPGAEKIKVGIDKDDKKNLVGPQGPAPEKPQLANVKLGYQEGKGKNQKENVDDGRHNLVAPPKPEQAKPELQNVKLAFKEGQPKAPPKDNEADKKHGLVGGPGPGAHKPEIAGVKLAYADGIAKDVKDNPADVKAPAGKKDDAAKPAPADPKNVKLSWQE